MKEPFVIILLMTPPTVSIPKVSGVASMMTISFVASEVSPQIIPP